MVVRRLSNKLLLQAALIVCLFAVTILTLSLAHELYPALAHRAPYTCGGVRCPRPVVTPSMRLPFRTRPRRRPEESPTHTLTLNDAVHYALLRLRLRCDDGL